MQHKHWFKEEQKEKKNHMVGRLLITIRQRQWRGIQMALAPTPLEAWIAAWCTQPGWADESVRYVWKHRPLEMKETRKQQIFSNKGWWPAFLLKTANWIVVVLFFQHSSLKSRHSSYPIQTARSGVWKKFLLLHTPPAHIIGPITSKLHQRRAEEKCLFCFALTLYESESVPMLLFGWTNCFGGAWGVQEPNPLGAFDNRGTLLAGRSAAELQEEPLQCGIFWICTVHGSSRMA